MPLRYTVEIPEMDDLIADVRRSGGDASRLMNSAISNSLEHMQSEIRGRARHRTGTLQRSVQKEVMNMDGRVSVEEKYGIFHEQGTGVYGPLARPITPKNAKVLAFAIGGAAVFARSVKGIKARPFFKPGIDASQNYIRAQFDKVGDILMRGLAGR